MPKIEFDFTFKRTILEVTTSVSVTILFELKIVLLLILDEFNTTSWNYVSNYKAVTYKSLNVTYVWNAILLAFINAKSETNSAALATAVGILTIKLAPPRIDETIDDVDSAFFSPWPFEQ